MIPDPERTPHDDSNRHEDNTTPYLWTCTACVTAQSGQQLELGSSNGRTGCPEKSGLDVYSISPLISDCKVTDGQTEIFWTNPQESKNKT